MNSVIRSGSCSGMALPLIGTVGSASKQPARLEPSNGTSPSVPFHAQYTKSIAAWFPTSSRGHKYVGTGVVVVVVYVQPLYALAASSAMMMHVRLDAKASTDASVHSKPAHSVRLSGSGQNELRYTSAKATRQFAAQSVTKGVNSDIRLGSWSGIALPFMATVGRASKQAPRLEPSKGRSLSVPFQAQYTRSIAA